MNVVGEDFFGLRSGLLVLAFGVVELGQLHARPRVGMLVDDALPNGDGSISLAQGRERFGHGHHGVAVVVLRIFGADTFEQRQRFRSSLLAKQALAEMGASVDVLGVAFECSAIAGFRFLEFALLKVDVAELGVMVGFVEMMDLGLQFFDPSAVLRAW